MRCTTEKVALTCCFCLLSGVGVGCRSSRRLSASRPCCCPVAQTCFSFAVLGGGAVALGGSRGWAATLPGCAGGRGRHPGGCRGCGGGERPTDHLRIRRPTTDASTSTLRRWVAIVRERVRERRRVSPLCVAVALAFFLNELPPQRQSS